MAEYHPILKAKQGELTALQNDDAPQYSPIVEVVPWERDPSADSIEVEASDESEVRKLTDRLLRAWGGKSRPMFIDTAAAEPDPENGWGFGSSPILSRVLEVLHPRMDALPVYRLSTDAAYVAAVGDVAHDIGIKRAAIRITAEDLDDTFNPLRESVARVAEDAELSRENVDVVVDFGAVDEGKSAMATRLARFILPQLDGEGWRSLVLASGAFPVNLSEVAPKTYGRIERYDYRLFQSLAALRLQAPIAFSDYVVGHPELQTGGAFAAPPQLRYTVASEWLVGKGSRNDRQGHAQFYEICQRLLERAGPEARPATDSWGDFRIHQAAAVARSGNADVGPGNASTWRAIATSHHLALIPRQLSGSAEP